MNTNLFRLAIQQYTGYSVSNVEASADPKVSGSYALRATLANGDTLDFILTSGWSSRDVASLVERLNETEFATWPPASR